MLVPRDGEAQRCALLRVFLKREGRTGTGVLEVVSRAVEAFLEFGMVFAQVVPEAEEATRRACTEFCRKGFGETSDALLVIVQRLPLSGVGCALATVGVEQAMPLFLQACLGNTGAYGI